MSDDFRLDLESLTRELMTGAFHKLSPSDAEAFLGANESCLIGEVRRGNHMYLCIFDPIDCQFEVNEWGTDSKGRVWQVCSVTGKIEVV